MMLHPVTDRGGALSTLEIHAGESHLRKIEGDLQFKVGIERLEAAAKGLMYICQYTFPPEAFKPFSTDVINPLTEPFKQSYSELASVVSGYSVGTSWEVDLPNTVTLYGRHRQDGKEEVHPIPPEVLLEVRLFCRSNTTAQEATLTEVYKQVVDGELGRYYDMVCNNPSIKGAVLVNFFADTLAYRGEVEKARQITSKVLLHFPQAQDALRQMTTMHPESFDAKVYGGLLILQ